MTSASTAPFATELYSNAALRLKANSGSVYIQTAGDDPAASIQLRANGTIAFKATSFDGLNTTAVFG